MLQKAFNTDFHKLGLANSLASLSDERFFIFKIWPDKIWLPYYEIAVKYVKFLLQTGAAGLKQAKNWSAQSPDDSGSNY